MGRRMNRRAFLHGAATAGAGLLTTPYISTAAPNAAVDNAQSILGQAEQRIQQHRMGGATLTITLPGRRVLASDTDVQIRQQRHKFLFGCNIFKLNRCRTPEHNAAYADRFSDLLNFATLPFYWWNYERTKGQPQDKRTEDIVRWCKAHGITTKGHPLAWNWADPPWLNGTPDEVMRLQLERIERCVRRFKGDIDIWDVVNEATHYNRAEPKERAPLLTDAIEKMGVEAYIRTAFQKARHANPQATLLINDYRTDPAYADKVISKLVDDSQRPLYDVVGIQSHMHGRYWGVQRAWAVCDRFAKFGKPLHFTETTVVSGPKQGSGWLTTPEGEERQAKDVAEFYTVLFSHPAVEAITWWDFTDQNAWQRAPAGLIRDDMSPKPAYERLRDLIKNKWWTRVDAKAEPSGKVSFKGFFGAYEVAVRQGDRRLTGTFTLDRDTTSGIDVQLT